MFPSSDDARPASRSSRRSLANNARNEASDDPVEMSRDRDAKKAANAIQQETDDLGHPSAINSGDSVLFPADSASNVGRRFERSNSFTAVPAAGRTPLQENSNKTYGAEGVDTEVLMADSRPTTPTGPLKPIAMRSSATNVSLNQSEADTTAAGYVFFGDDDAPLSDRAASPPVVKRSVKRGTPGFRDLGRVNSMHGVLDDPSSMSRTGTNSVMFPTNVTENGLHASEEKPPHPDELSENELWYLLRTLVGHELQYEHAQLHKLSSLGISDDDFRGPDDDGETAPLDPKKVPIMRYLIKHFLLTMPIVRDSGRTGEAGEDPGYWTDGLYPLIQKVHAADFSKAVDQGQTGFLSRTYDNYFLKALERFVSSGLKLASAKPQLSQGPGGALGKLPFEKEPVNLSHSPILGRSTGTVTNGKTNGHKDDDEDVSDTATETNVRRADDETDDDDDDDVHSRPRPLSRQTGTTALTGDNASFVSAPEGASTVGDNDDRGEPTSSGGWLAWVTGSKPGENGDDTERLAAQDDDTAKHDVPDRSGAATPTPGGEESGNAYVVPDAAGTNGADGTPRPKSRASSRPRSRSSRRNVADADDVRDEPREVTPAPISIPSNPRQEPVGEPQQSADIKSKKKRGFSFNFLKKRKSSVGNEQRQSQATSRQVPAQNGSSIAAMAIPIDAEDKPKPASVPVDLALVSKAGVAWPFGAPVPFWRGTPFQRLRWGGFEADVIGVRSSLFGKSFIIRVRRPQRLDEYVVRTEDQFRKFFRNMDKFFPDAHIRQVPSGASKGDEQIVPAASKDIRPLSVMSPSESRFSMLDARSRKAQSVAPTDVTEKGKTGSRSKLSTALAAASEPVASTPPPRKRASSLFGRGFRNSSATSVAPSQSASAAPKAPAAAGSAVNLPTYLNGPIDIKKLPHDSQRRALRNWLRDTLSIRTVGHHRETAAFLLLGSFVPKEMDLKDIRQREFIDEARRLARVEVASGAAERVRSVKEARDQVAQEFIAGDGFATISETIRKVPKLGGLPDRYLKTIEWMRLHVAETLLDSFVNGPGAATAFSKLKALHQSFPYFLLRQAFRLPNPNTMAKVLQDILLARPFGSKSLLQKILAIVLDDDPTKLLEEIQKYRTKIGSPAMTEKLDIFVYSDRRTKDSIRRYARDNNIELVLCILRGAEEPRLPSLDLQRAVRAGKAYRHFVKKNAAAGGKLVAEDPATRLVIDLQMYLRLVSKDRDSNVTRELLADESTADALEVVVGPFVELIKRVYKAGNGGQAITDLEKFLDQLIIIVEALRNRVQEPQKGIRILARLLARHEEALYRFIRDTHTKETIVEEFLQWAWTLSAFLQRGMSQMIDLDTLLPTDTEDRAYLFDEVEAITDYHTKKRSRDYQNMCRRYAGDVDADDPISVEGDGRGKSRLDAYVDPKPKKPRLEEVPYYVSSFRSQLRKVFAV